MDDPRRPAVRVARGRLGVGHLIFDVMFGGEAVVDGPDNGLGTELVTLILR